MTYTAPAPAPVAAPVAAAPASSTSPLTGEALLARFDALREAGTCHADIAVECGYYIKVAEGPRAGEVRASTSRLNQAILEAQGLVAPGKKSAANGGGRNVVVNKFGRAALSAAALASIGATPGDFIKATKVEEGLLVTLAATQACAV